MLLLVGDDDEVNLPSIATSRERERDSELAALQTLTTVVGSFFGSEPMEGK